MLTEERQYSPVYSGFILQIESASQRPSREFDVDSVRNHYCWSVFMPHSRSLSKCGYNKIAFSVRLCCEPSQEVIPCYIMECYVGTNASITKVPLFTLTLLRTLLEAVPRTFYLLSLPVS